MKSSGIWEHSGSYAVFQDHIQYQKINHVFGFYQAPLQHKSSHTYEARLGRANEQPLSSLRTLLSFNPPVEKPQDIVNAIRCFLLYLVYLLLLPSSNPWKLLNWLSWHGEHNSQSGAWRSINIQSTFTSLRFPPESLQTLFSSHHSTSLIILSLISCHPPHRPQIPMNPEKSFILTLIQQQLPNALCQAHLCL